MAKNIPKTKEEYIQIDPKLKANMALIKGYQECSERKYARRTHAAEDHGQMQYHDHDPMSGVIAHLMTNIKECYDKVLAQSQTIAELLLEGQHVDWKDFDLKKFNSRLDYIKAVLSTTIFIKDIGKRIIG